MVTPPCTSYSIAGSETGGGCDTGADFFSIGGGSKMY